MNDAPITDTREMLHWLALLEHGLIEIRALGSAGGLAGFGLYDNIEACVADVALISGKANVYVGLQPRPIRLFYRAPNRIVRSPRTARDDEIEVLTNVVFDLDAVRPKGQASTDEELERVREVALEVRRHLEGAGIREPLEVFTGNGIHLIYAIPPISSAHPGYQSAIESIRTWEGNVAAKFSSSSVKVDRINNPSRIVRLAGTLNLKGNNTPDRPRRISRILHLPSQRVENPALLAATTARSPETSPPALPLAETSRRTQLAACEAIGRLWKEGYPADRSMGIWAMARYLRFEGVPEDLTAESLRDFDARTGQKLAGRSDAARYLSRNAQRAGEGAVTIPCRWLHSVSLCPGVARCNYGKETIKIPASPAIVAGDGTDRPPSTREDHMSWKPKEMQEEVAVRAGEYKAKIIEASDTTSKASGAAMTTVRFRVVSEGANNGLEIWEHFVRNQPTAQRYMLALLTAIGLQDREVVENDDIVGKELIVEIEVKEYEGLPQGRIKKYSPLTTRA